MRLLMIFLLALTGLILMSGCEELGLSDNVDREEVVKLYHPHWWHADTLQTDVHYFYGISDALPTIAEAQEAALQNALRNAAYFMQTKVSFPTRTDSNATRFHSGLSNLGRLIVEPKSVTLIQMAKVDNQETISVSTGDKESRQERYRCYVRVEIPARPISSSTGETVRPENAPYRGNSDSPVYKDREKAAGSSNPNMNRAQGAGKP